ncbi:hypothetical protein, partial [Gemmiger formicilis]|uniref:hypothetical protein n=1 Tax=Gemmiger formicilis TaxID=745368 RepID=UPI00242BCD95
NCVGITVSGLMIDEKCTVKVVRIQGRLTFYRGYGRLNIIVIKKRFIEIKKQICMMATKHRY